MIRHFTNTLLIGFMSVICIAMVAVTDNETFITGFILGIFVGIVITIGLLVVFFTGD